MAEYEGNAAKSDNGDRLELKLGEIIVPTPERDLANLKRIIGFYESQGVSLDDEVSAAEFYLAPEEGQLTKSDDSQERKPVREFLAEYVEHLFTRDIDYATIEHELMPYEITKDPKLWEKVLESSRVSRNSDISDKVEPDSSLQIPLIEKRSIDDGKPRSPLQQYLKEAVEVPLLTKEEEIDLAYEIQAGNPAAREHMSRANLRFVVRIAKKYSNRGLPLIDLIEEGNVGLMKAVDSFDPEQGARFSTYSSWWIKQAIKRALINSVPQIHVPDYMVELIAQYKAVIREHELEHNTTPSVDDIANIMEVSTEKVEMIKKAAKAFQRPSQSPVNEDGKNFTMEERLTDTKGHSPDQAAIYKGTNEKLYKTIETLDERESQIIRLKFGLDGEEPLTLKQIGGMVGLTSKRVWQIETKALKKLKEYMTKDGVTYP